MRWYKEDSVCYKGNYGCCRLRFNLFLVIVIIVISVGRFYHRRRLENIDGSYDKSQINVETIDVVNRESRSGIRLKEILLWTSFYKDRYYGLSKYGRSGFIERKCPINTCTLTNDRRKLTTADAVVVHARNPDMKPLPKRQNQKQIFVFFLHEAPPACFWNDRYTIPDDDKSSFNLTITYRYDSDIVRPGIGKLVKNDFPANIPTISLKERTRSVVWVTSHCSTPGKRELYIQALSRYIDVDIYGKCGYLNCSYGDPCNKAFDKKYKFFIAAENAVCKDYVTEKVNKALSMNIVPIVYGGLNYKRYMPPNSYVDVMDFASPRELASYLKQVAVDEWKYREFFTWKASYHQVNVPIASTMCKLCEKLHNPIYHKLYPDIVQWWTENSCNNAFITNLFFRGLV
ncbi:hypothetical protein LSH36_245g03090 [Paralvinella palmiformis]|uniref:Fucosyltransferase n=1 Tax=Paralvinella palmiformis TaxID=53620 RepID=A0AAD9JNH6_9ANNE|nr:hypothetical protein LSH36_245g03090 [Paralvinella palmiformis]